MAALTAHRRNQLPASEFALPEERAYPIDTESRGRNALARVSAYGSPWQRRKVRRAVARRYPQIHQEG